MKSKNTIQKKHLVDLLLSPRIEYEFNDKRVLLVDKVTGCKETVEFAKRITAYTLNAILDDEVSSKLKEGTEDTIEFYYAKEARSLVRATLLGIKEFKVVNKKN